MKNRETIFESIAMIDPLSSMRGNLRGRRELPWRVCRERVRLETEVGAPENCPRPLPSAGLHADRLVHGGGSVLQQGCDS